MVRPKVVIGDDSALARYLIRLALVGLDLEIHEAASGNGVIRLVDELQPDLLFLDLSMPGAGGLLVLKRLRADQQQALLPVIVVTVEGDYEVRARVEALGVTGYYLKPVDLKVLRDAALAVLSPGVQTSDDTHVTWKDAH